MTRTVFICGDTVHFAVLDQAAESLRAAGVHVVRGPSNVGGVKRYTKDECGHYFRDVEVGVFTVRHEVSRSLLEWAPKMRALCLPTIGVESVDIDAANERGVLIAHGATSSNVVGMAEATIMLTLVSLYRLHDAERRMRENVRKPFPPLAHCLMGKVVGLLGFGRIARAIAERLVPFQAQIITCSPRVPEASLPPYVNKVDLNTLLVRSDVLCVLVPLTPETHGMLGREELRLLKSSAVLINTARGETIDEQALIDVLREERIAGAALDTFAEEPLGSDSPLRRLENAILTPHMVGQTREAYDDIVPTITGNVMLMLRGEMPLHCKNPGIADRWLARNS